METHPDDQTLRLETLDGVGQFMMGECRPGLETDRRTDPPGTPSA
ncbi:MAG: hypothetical protein QGF68_02640 [Nitrospinota bacterium]|jgi:hypothetical protein|nr:hypothetical protein [Nitrospinota bacterium]HJM41857.1 hypothetical protein [Nitrospinota bacterium]